MLGPVAHLLTGLHGEPGYLAVPCRSVAGMDAAAATYYAWARHQDKEGWEFMNWKAVVLGGLAYYAAAFVVSMVSGVIIHEGILDAAYRATESFWRPELVQDPPDMAALMPMWIATGIVTSIILAGIYMVFRAALGGPAWQRGLKFGIAIWLWSVSLMAAWSGVFNLPGKIWIWWGVDAAIYTITGAIALGIVAQKLAPAD